jgi:hypothetical protein
VLLSGQAWRAVYGDQSEDISVLSFSRRAGSAPIVVCPLSAADVQPAKSIKRICGFLCYPVLLPLHSFSATGQQHFSLRTNQAAVLFS